MSDSVATTGSTKRTRKPVQTRSATRMAKVVEAAERLLEDVGPEKVSIPAIAEISGVPRAAIYPFFPDKYSLFSHIAKHHMEGMIEALIDAKIDPEWDWKGCVQRLIETVADYYNQHPAASILLLRGALADGDKEAFLAKNQAISALLRAKMKALGALSGLPESPDAAVLSAEIAFACMKHGYAMEETVSPTICQEAVYATQAYLARWEGT